MTLAAYLRRRTVYETWTAIVLITLGCLTSVAVEVVDHGRSGEPYPLALPWLLEITSHGALLLMLPALVWFDRRYPLRIATWRTHLPAHLAFSVAFSLGHVLLMYWARVALFPSIVGHGYHWDNWLGEFAYEFLKDFRTYFYILGFIYLYRFVLLRLQGEAGFVADDGAPETEAPDRFLIKKLGREFLVRVGDIDWIESAGNYVNLHVRDRVYPLRGTMAQTAKKLADKGFARVHRGAIVNLDRIADLRVFDSGDGEIRLTTDATVPMSRRYGQALRESLKAFA